MTTTGILYGDSAHEEKNSFEVQSEKADDNNSLTLAHHSPGDFRHISCSGWPNQGFAVCDRGLGVPRVV